MTALSLGSRPEPLPLAGFTVGVTAARAMFHLPYFHANIDVSKNSGGWQTHAQLEAAQALGVPVLMVARPVYPPAREVGTIEDAIASLHLDAS